MGRACRSGKRRLLTADKESCRSLPVIDARTPTAGFSIFDFDAYGSPLEPGVRCRSWSRSPMACAAPPFGLGNPRRVTRECRKNRERRWMAFLLSASSRPAISFCNLEKRHEGCRTWAGLAVPAAAVETPAYAVTETATKTRMHKAGASEPRVEEARVTKAEASEVWTEKAAAEPAVPASAKSDGNSDRPSPAPWVIPIPARCIIRVIPGVILWRIIRIALCLNGGASR